MYLFALELVHSDLLGFLGLQVLRVHELELSRLEKEPVHVMSTLQQQETLALLLVQDHHRVVHLHTVVTVTVVVLAAAAAAVVVVRVRLPSVVVVVVISSSGLVTWRSSNAFHPITRLG